MVQCISLHTWIVITKPIQLLLGTRAVSNGATARHPHYFLKTEKKILIKGCVCLWGHSPSPGRTKFKNKDIVNKHLTNEARITTSSAHGRRISHSHFNECQVCHHWCILWIHYGTTLKLMDLFLINCTLLLHREAITLLQGKTICLSSLHCSTF